MHESNRMFWAYCAQKYPRYFSKSSVIEIGSYNVNGSVRDHFESPIQYIGVDWRPGSSVDMVCFAHDLKICERFDAVISASMLEHDRHWEKSLRNMVDLMKDDGILLLSWGGAWNLPHELGTADDGCFHSLPAGHVLDLLEELRLYIHEFRYEGLQFPGQCMNDGMGEVCLVAFKSPSCATGFRHLDGLLPADRWPAETLPDPAMKDDRLDHQIQDGQGD